jgi:hypothetical protein
MIGRARLAMIQGEPRDEQTPSGYGCLGMQSIRTPSIANTATLREGLLSAQWVLRERLRHLEPESGDWCEGSCEEYATRLRTATSQHKS